MTIVRSYVSFTSITAKINFRLITAVVFSLRGNCSLDKCITILLNRNELSIIFLWSTFLGILKFRPRNSLLKILSLDIPLITKEKRNMYINDYYTMLLYDVGYC